MRLKSQTRLAVVDALFAAVWVNCWSRPNNPMAIYILHHKLFYNYAFNECSAIQSFPEVITLPLSVKTDFRIPVQSSPVISSPVISDTPIWIH